MANAEHLKILKEGVEMWNRLREKNENITPDLFRADLKGANLRSAKLFDDGTY